MPRFHFHAPLNPELYEVPAAFAGAVIVSHLKSDSDGRGLGPRSTEARLMDKQRRIRMKGALQPERETVFEPFIFVGTQEIECGG